MNSLRLKVERLGIISKSIPDTEFDGLHIYCPRMHILFEPYL